MGGLTSQQEVLEKSARRCCLCYGLHGDLSTKSGQIAHLDRNRRNNVVDNLAFLCLEHHDEYDTRTSQSKGWTMKEVKRYRDALYMAIEEMRNNAKKKTREASIPSQNELPIFGQIFCPASRMTLDAVDKDTGRKHFGVPAYSLIYGFHFTFDVTNPNKFDMRILHLYVDVIKFVDIDIIGVWVGDLGGGMKVREFECKIEPSIGRYDCYQISKDFHYIKLSSGEMEAFLINVEVVKEGIYRLRVGMEYSLGGKTRTAEADDDILDVGVFDPVFHQPSYNWSERSIEPSCEFSRD
jgi:hypothetical protein